MLKPVMTLFGIILASNAFAGTLLDIPPAGQYVIGLSPALTWVSGNKTQTFNSEPDVLKTYTANHNISAFPALTLFLGWQKPLPKEVFRQSLMGQLGIDIVAAGEAKLKGDIWDDGDPDFNNYAYSYKIQHAHVAIKGRLIANAGYVLDPYISGSLGVGFNRAFDFTINPLVSSAVPQPPFHSNTTTTFIYSIGIGLQKSFNSHCQAALGYEFSNWGKTQLSRATGQTVNQGLTINNLYAQQIQLSLYYIF